MATTTDVAAPRARIDSLDVIRGAVMVLMAIDHVRVYSGQPAGGPTAGIFFTRWVTHFCAPAFVLFAGTAAFLHGKPFDSAGVALSGSAQARLARFLVTRGLMLVVFELTIVRFSWTFNFNYANFTLAGVIWMTGWCMVLLAALVRLRPRTVGIFGLAVILLQQVFGLLPRALPENARASVAVVWNFFYPSGADGWAGMQILYTIVPWIGVMAAGYGLGAVMIREPAERQRFCLRVGLSAIALFIVFAGVFLVFGPGDDGEAGPWLFRALNQQKYPASQPFLLMTLGPALVMLALVDQARGRVAAMFRTFGRVPMFYYLLHIPLIHVTALAVWAIRDGGIGHLNLSTAPYVWMPKVEPWSLPLLYVVFVIDVAVLYFPCRWFAAYKARHKRGWLSYI